MPIARYLVFLGEVDKIVDTRLFKPGKPCTRILIVVAQRIFAGQQAAGNDPIGVGQRSIHN